MTSFEKKVIDALEAWDARAVSKAPPVAPALVGSLEVLKCSSNPDRFAQSAHSMREVFEKLRFAIATSAGPTAGARLDKLRKALTQAQASSGAWVESEKLWRGDIDEHVRRLLSALEMHVTERSLGETRNTHRNAFIGTYTVAGVPEPDVRIKELVERWNALERYFTEICHHQSRSEDFASQVKAALQLLLEIVPPPERSRLDALDEIRKLGESE